MRLLKEQSRALTKVGTEFFQKNSVPYSFYPVPVKKYDKIVLYFKYFTGESIIMGEIRKHIVFHGRVQGVGFRYTARHLACSLGVTGWVKNEWDGTVIMEVQGREVLIDELLKGINRNSFIDIEWMDTKEMPVEIESCFSVR